MNNIFGCDLSFCDIHKKKVRMISKSCQTLDENNVNSLYHQSQSKSQLQSEKEVYDELVSKMNVHKNHRLYV